MPTFAKSEAEALKRLEKVLPKLASTPERKRQVKQGLEKAKKMSNELISARKLNSTIVRKPITI